jgi:hypothetical protein
MIAHIKRSDKPYLKDEVSILNCMMHHLVHYMNSIGLTTTNQLLETYYAKIGNNFD